MINLWDNKRWRIALAEYWLVKEQVMKLDSKEMWEYHLPRPASTDESIHAAETLLGERLHPKHRMFLAAAAGWKAFWHDVDLLGPDELGTGSLFARGQESLAVLANEGVIDDERYFPIAVSRDDMDLFVIGREDSDEYGTVVWLADQEIDRFDDFQEFFLSMREYQKKDIEYFRSL